MMPEPRTTQPSCQYHRNQTRGSPTISPDEKVVVVLMTGEAIGLHSSAGFFRRTETNLPLHSQWQLCDSTTAFVRLLLPVADSFHAMHLCWVPVIIRKASVLIPGPDSPITALFYPYDETGLS